MVRCLAFVSDFFLLKNVQTVSRTSQPPTEWLLKALSRRRVKRPGHESNAGVKKACTYTCTLTYAFETCRGATIPPSAFTFLSLHKQSYRSIECDSCERQSGERFGHFCHEVGLAHDAFVHCLHERAAWKIHCVVVYVYKVKVKFTLEVTSKAHRGSRGIVLLFL